MIGVVVWSNTAKEKAVVWCEDQASLAYLQGRTNLIDADYWPDAGDLVELDSEMVGNLRHARRVSILTEQGCPQLPQLLRATGPDDRRSQHLRVVSTCDQPAPAKRVAGFDLPPARACAGR